MSWSLNMKYITFGTRGIVSGGTTIIFGNSIGCGGTQDQWDGPGSKHINNQVSLSDGPDGLSVEGPGSINGKEKVKLKCTTSPSNQPSRWLFNMKMVGWKKLIIRLVWRIINQLGEDLTEEVVEETNQEDSWTPDGQVWWWSWWRRWWSCWSWL